MTSVWIRAKEAAQLLDLDPQTVGGLGQDGIITRKNFGRGKIKPRWRYLRSDCEAQAGATSGGEAEPVI